MSDLPQMRRKQQGKRRAQSGVVERNFLGPVGRAERLPRGFVTVTATVGGVTGRSTCVRLFTFDPNNITVALRWEPAVSDSSIMAVDRQESLPQSHCFRALKTGTVTVLGSFGGKTARKSITVE
jgi:hypothetical protein